MELVTIQLTPEDAKLFIEFQKHYRFITALERMGALNIKSGTLTINFDNIGEVGSFEVKNHYNLLRS